MAETYFVGVDVGTGSVRAALVASTGKVHKVHVKNTQTWNPLPDHYEQSSDDIWSGICECVQVYSSRNFNLLIPKLILIIFVFQDGYR